MKRSRSKHWGGFTVWELVVVVVVLVFLVGWFIPALLARQKAMDSRTNCANSLKQISMAVRVWAGDNGDRSPDQVPVSEGGLANTNATKAPAWAAFQFFQVMSNELAAPRILSCPQDLKRPLAGPIGYGGFAASPRGYFGNLVVSYFVGSGAAPTSPGMLLSGDRNIYGPTTTPDSNDGYGNSPTNGSGSRVVFGSKPAKVGWTSRIHRQKGNVAFADGSVQQLSSAGLLQALANSGDTNTIPGANVIVFP